MVDDNASSRLILEQLLREFDGLPLLAGSGLEALALVRGELAAARPIDIILIDSQMPGMNGSTLAGKLRANPDSAHIPLLALICAHERGAGAQILAAGFDAHIAKPVRRTQLARSLLSLLPEALQARHDPQR